LLTQQKFYFDPWNIPLDILKSSNLAIFTTGLLDANIHAMSIVFECLSSIYTYGLRVSMDTTVTD